MSDLTPPAPPPEEPPPDEPPPYGAPPAPPYGQAYQPYGPVPGGVPAYGGAPVYGYGQPHGGATTAMVLGIISTACAVLNLACCFSAVVSVITGPIAIVMGLRARDEIDRRPGSYSNRGAAVTGLVTGIIGTVLGVLMFVAVIALFGLSGTV